MVRYIKKPEPEDDQPEQPSIEKDSKESKPTATPTNDDLNNKTEIEPSVNLESAPSLESNESQPVLPDNEDSIANELKSQIEEKDRQLAHALEQNRDLLNKLDSEGSGKPIKDKQTLLKLKKLEEDEKKYQGLIDKKNGEIAGLNKTIEVLKSNKSSDSGNKQLIKKESLIRRISNIVFKHLTIFLSSLIILCGISITTYLKIEPRYESIVDIKVTKDKFDLSFEQLNSLDQFKKLIEIIDPIDIMAPNKQSLLDELVYKHRKNIRIVPIKDQELIRIHIISMDPHKAALIAKALVEHNIGGLEVNQKFSKDKKRLVDLDLKIQEIQTTINNEDSRMGNLKGQINQFKVTSKKIKQYKKIVSESKITLENMIVALDSQIVSIKDIVDENMNSGPLRFLANSNLEKNSEFLALKQELAQLEFTKYFAAAEFGMDHKKVKSINKKINAFKDKVITFVKGTSKISLSIDEESALAFYNRLLFLHAREQALKAALNSNFIDDDEFGETKKELRKAQTKMIDLQLKQEELLSEKQYIESLLKKELGNIDFKSAAPLAKPSMKYQEDRFRLLLLSLCASVILSFICTIIFNRFKES